MIDNVFTRAIASAMGLDPDDFNEVEFHDMLDGGATLVYVVGEDGKPKPEIRYPE